MLDNLNLREDIVHKQEDRIPDSIIQELDYWEKAVFSFDMDRSSNAGASSSSTGTNDATAQRENTERRRRDSTRRPNPGSATLEPEGTPLDQLQNPSLLQLLNMQTQEGIQRSLPQPSQQSLASQPGMLDPYTLAQLAAIGALVSPTVAGSSAQPINAPGNQNDPYTVLRQVQSLLYPYGLPGGTNHPSLPNLSQAYPPVQQPVPTRAMPGNLQSQPISRQRSLDSSSASWSPFSGSNQVYPPLDPALSSQYSHLSPPPGHLQQIQSAEAGPSSAVNMSRRSPSSPLGSPTIPQSVDETAVAEDKRRRNTAASARFRIKKKHKVLQLERSVVELEARAEDLEREAAELRRENGWLKEMLIMKGRSMRGSKQRSNTEDVEDDEEETEDEGGKGESSDKGKGKGKEKE